MMKNPGFKLIILILLLTLARFAFAQKDFSREFKVMRVPVGKTITISLEANPTTGFSWRLASISDKDVLEFLKKEFTPSGEKIAGAGGAENWSFKTLKNGQSVIVFEYAREWEKGLPPAKREEFSVFVR